MKINFKKSVGLFVICVLTFICAFTGFEPSYKVYAADGDDFIPSPSPVIVEQFTGGWCGACPYASAGIHYSQMVLNGEEDVFVHLAYHYRDSLATADTEKRAGQYDITAYPTVIIGGLTKMIGVPSKDGYLDFDQYVEVIREYSMNKSTVADIELVADFDSHSFNVKVKAKEDFGKRKINIVAAIYQDWVNCQLKNGASFNRNTVRKMPYGVSGKPIKLKADQIYEETRKFVLTTRASEQCGIVVFLQDQDTQEIVGSALYKFATKKTALFYWNVPQMGNQEKNTCLGTMTFKVINATDLKKVYIKLHKVDEYFSLKAVALSKALKDKATIDFNARKWEVTVEFNEPFNGSADIFNLLVNFKKESGDYGIVFKLIQFMASDSSKNSVPFELIDLSFFSGVHISPNPYDLDENGTIDENDVIVVEKAFGTEKGDKEFKKQCDFNKDRRIDLEDLNELMHKEGWRILKEYQD
ncbi:MAG: hypothetical protein KAH01_03485 [Caldisericia bacterium]|nr:hypothetical protein [Caldisericia bacterium]